MTVSTAHYVLEPVAPPPDTTAVDTATIAVAGQVTGAIERHTYQPPDGPAIVTHHAQIHAPFDRTGAAPVDTTDPALLDDLAAVAAALAAELRATTQT